MQMLEMLRRYNPLHERFGYLGLIAIGILVLVLGFLVRTDIIAQLADLILELIGWVGILGGVVLAIAGAIGLASEKGWLNLPTESGSDAATAEAGTDLSVESDGDAATEEVGTELSVESGDEAIEAPPTSSAEQANRGGIGKRIAALVMGVLAAILMLIGGVVAMYIGTASSDNATYEQIIRIAEFAENMGMTEENFTQDNLDRMFDRGLQAFLFAFVGAGGAILGLFFRRSGALVMAATVLVSFIIIVTAYILAPILIILGLVSILLFVGAVFLAFKP